METDTQGPIVASAWPSHEHAEHVYALQHSPDGMYAAAAISNGTLRILDREGRMLQRQKTGAPLDDTPLVAAKWFPRTEDEGEAPYHIAAASSAGALLCWSFSEGVAERTIRLIEEQNQTSACDVSRDGLAIATVGSDRCVRIYDVERKCLVHTHTKGVDEEGYTLAAHTNRIFSVRYLSPTLLVTAGWQSPIRLWDLRTGRAERHISGAQCGADALEPVPGTTTLIAASTRMEDQLQVFDFIAAREVEEDSKRLSSSIGRLPVSQVRLGAAPGRKVLWYAGAQGGLVGCVDFSTGQAVGRATLTGAVLGLEAHPCVEGRALACGMRDTVIQLDVATT